MPTIKRFTNCKIAVYGGDHNPPHFHIEGRGVRALVEIETTAVLKGDASAFTEALAWAAEDANKTALRSEWARLNGTR